MMRTALRSPTSSWMTSTTTTRPSLVAPRGGRIVIHRRDDVAPFASAAIVFPVGCRYDSSIGRHLSSSSSSSTASQRPSVNKREEESKKDAGIENRIAPPIVAREYRGHNFPDFIDEWDRSAFRRVGYGLIGATSILSFVPFLHRGSDVAAAATAAIASDANIATATSTMLIACPPLSSFLPAMFAFGLTSAYWKIGTDDVDQVHHAIRRNYPVLGNVRYALEVLRPEIRQYFVESDVDGRPLDRMGRSLVYRRSKGVDDTMPFGTRLDVYGVGYEWACHSMFPRPPVAHDDDDDDCDHEDDDFDIGGRTRGRNRTTVIGTPEYGTSKPYAASLLNVSAMSYGAIGDNAILALSTGANMGRFYHNTGEGGVSKSHRDGGGDLVWNVGTGYFGCGTTSSINGGRVFDESSFRETIHENTTIRMIELKVSQGAKPGHGGILPKSKITPEIAAARKLTYPPTFDCHSPPNHSAFSDHRGLIEFVSRLREYSGGMPVGIKLCVGDPRDVACLVRAMIDVGTGPDFITVDGGEGGTGAAPPEYSDSVGMPLEEGLVVVRNLLIGAGLRSKVRIVASGKVTNGFSLVRTLALGADATCAARAFMLSLGCIQALKCNTNRCPTGIATQDRDLQYGLDPAEKSHRVYNFHRKTMDAAAEIVGTIGHDRFSDLSANDIMRRISDVEVKTLEDYLPSVEPESLLKGCAPRNLQKIWDGTATGAKRSEIRWIY